MLTHMLCMSVEAWYLRGGVRASVHRQRYILILLRYNIAEYYWLN